VRIFIIAFSFFVLLACTVDKEAKITLDKLKIRDSIKDSLRQVLRDSVINTSAVGEEAQETPEYRRMSWIIKNSDNEELKELTRTDNAFLKAIGVKGLFMKKDKGWFSNIVPILRDTGEYVSFQDGCLGYNYRLPEYCLLEVLRYESMDGILTREQTDSIDGLIEEYKINVLPKQTDTTSANL
jgi:hypothetical protein